MHDLHGSVHACIGATGSNDFDGMIRDLAQGGFNSRLHPASVRLRLPT
jgi:hypothetical protein